MSTLQTQKSVNPIQKKTTLPNLKSAEYYRSLLHQQLELIDKNTLKNLVNALVHKKTNEFTELRVLPNKISQDSIEALQEVSIMIKFISTLQQRLECQRKIITSSIRKNLPKPEGLILTPENVKICPFESAYFIDRLCVKNQETHQLIVSFVVNEVLINLNESNLSAICELETRWFTPQFYSDLPKVLSLLRTDAPQTIKINKLATFLVNSSDTNVGFIH